VQVGGIRNQKLEMWIIYAFLAALFAGATSILAKAGVRGIDSHLATALRTVVVLLFAWLMVFIVHSQSTISEISIKSFIFLILSGLATGASWLCYFRALQIGDINKVVPIDKSSTVLTVFLAFLFLHEQFTWVKGLCMLLILGGTYLMIDWKHAPAGATKNRAYLLYAVFSAIFAALTAILAKIGITAVESNLGTAIRTVVVLAMAWVIVLVSGKIGQVRSINKRNRLFLVLSGLATGFSWLCYFKALQQGPVSIVAPIDKLSILVSVAFAYLVFKEKLTRLSLAGLVLVVAGTLLLLV
jgi:transporter family protein